MSSKSTTSYPSRSAVDLLIDCLPYSRPPLCFPTSPLSPPPIRPPISSLRSSHRTASTLPTSLSSPTSSMALVSDSTRSPTLSSRSNAASRAPPRHSSRATSISKVDERARTPLHRLLRIKPTTRTRCEAQDGRRRLRIRVHISLPIGSRDRMALCRSLMDRQ